jgi:hypothetical protein
MPTARQPLILAICPTAEPTAPEAAETTTVSFRRGIVCTLESLLISKRSLVGAPPAVVEEAASTSHS